MSTDEQNGEDGTDSGQVEGSGKTDVDSEKYNVAMHLSYDLQKHNALHYIDKDVALLSAGSSFILVDLTSLEQQYVPCADQSSVGALGVHPDKSVLAVATKSNSVAPVLVLYSYPALALVKTLNGGTEHEYTALSFDTRSDNRLAAVGSSPDFTLTIWDWRLGTVLLRAKGASQTVTNLQFSRFVSGALVSSGTVNLTNPRLCMVR